jgi:Porin subfamily
VWAYTAQFGGGFSGTISSEARRTTQIIDANALPPSAPVGGFAALSGAGSISGGYPCAATVTSAGGIPGSGVGGCGSLLPGNGAYGGMQAPDLVANLRVDQAWGGAQVMGALHEVNAGYYSTANAFGAQNAPSTTGAAGAGHPGDRWGWAAGVGIKINTPFITQGDWFQAQANVTQGALRYLFNTPNSNWGKVDRGQEAFGVLSDCVYGGAVTAAVTPGNNTGCQLTSAWGINASYEHYWTPAWHTSLYGAFYEVSYGKGTGSGNAMLCSATGFGNASYGSLAAAGAGCNMDWQTWGIGSRTQWDVTKTFYLGVEVLYSQLHSAQTGAAGALVGGAGLPTFAISNSGATTVENNSSNWSISIRAHRDFLP